MQLTPHETLILKDLQQLHKSRKQKQALNWLMVLTGSLGLGLLLLLQPQNLSVLIAAALCGGLLGVCIEKAYLTKIVAITLKLYQTHTKETLNP